MLIERLKQMLGRSPLPADTRRLVAGARSTTELARELDELVTANDLELRTLQKEIEELERREQEEAEKVRSAGVGARSRRISLLHIRRLRRQQDGLESRLRIHDQNMSLHLGLLSKIQSLEAMEMRGIEEAEIDSVVLDFEEELGRYSRAMEAGAAAAAPPPLLDSERDRELAELEAEIVVAAEDRAAARRAEVEAKALPARREPAAGARRGGEEASGRRKVEEADAASGARRRLPPEAET
ncbi:MAG: hypothetical protein JXA90_17240 [Planctomycetes bacterium]|nr:hypothetical protein [Planctomycetota bacterium]